MPELIANDPSTWKRLQDHPSFMRYEFSEEWRTWYEGDDPEKDLLLLRQCSLELLKHKIDAKFELVVLDDLTTFVDFRIGRIKGQYGTGSTSDSVFVHLDTDPTNNYAFETEVDDLSLSEFVRTVYLFIEESDLED